MGAGATLNRATCHGLWWLCFRGLNLCGLCFCGLGLDELSLSNFGLLRELEVLSGFGLRARLGAQLAGRVGRCFFRNLSRDLNWGVGGEHRGDILPHHGPATRALSPSTTAEQERDGGAQSKPPGQA